jgi:hypothetical protein
VHGQESDILSETLAFMHVQDADFLPETLAVMHVQNTDFLPEGQDADFMVVGKSGQLYDSPTGQFYVTGVVGSRHIYFWHSQVQIGSGGGSKFHVWED